MADISIKVKIREGVKYENEEFGGLTGETVSLRNGEIWHVQFDDESAEKLSQDYIEASISEGFNPTGMAFKEEDLIFLI